VVSSKDLSSAYIYESDREKMKTKVSLKGMKFYSYHGFYESERRLGNNFILDVETEVDLSVDPDDQIDLTVNYESIYAICNKIMQLKYKLLESVAYDIAYKVKTDFPIVSNVKVTLAKLNPPVGGKVDKSEVIIEL